MYNHLDEKLFSKYHGKFMKESFVFILKFVVQFFSTAFSTEDVNLIIVFEISFFFARILSLVKD